MRSRIGAFLFPKSIANDGSQLRDHLANERTFLSWTRMGLAFAAMALALGRLGMIDRFISGEFANRRSNNAASLGQTTTENKDRRSETGRRLEEGNYILASQVCWTASISSFGYSVCRYISIRQALLQGRFSPAILGPVFMTCASLASVGLVSSGVLSDAEKDVSV